MSGSLDRITMVYSYLCQNAFFKRMTERLERKEKKDSAQREETNYASA